MKLTSVEPIGRSQLISGVRPILGRTEKQKGAGYRYRLLGTSCRWDECSEFTSWRSKGRREMKMLLTLTLALGTTFVFAEGRPVKPVPLFLTTPATSGGFTDPNKERQDSMKDLTEALSKKKNIRLVTTQEEAIIVLEVLGRDVREDSGSYSKMFGGKNEVKNVRVKLTVGEFITELSGSSAGGGFGGGPGRGAWKKAAYKVADQIEKWVQDNQAQLSK